MKKLFGKWLELNKRYDNISYETDGDQPEFGGDKQTLEDFTNFQLDNIRDYESALELDMRDIEKELNNDGYRIINVFNEKKRKFEYRLVTDKEYKRLLTEELISLSYRRDDIEKMSMEDVERLAYEKNIYL